jgi:hypothetical protein
MSVKASLESVPFPATFSVVEGRIKILFSSTITIPSGPKLALEIECPDLCERTMLKVQL